jgi:hypothetical protein
VLDRTVKHLLDGVLPRADGYLLAEQALSTAFDAAGKDITVCQDEARRAVRCAEDVAVAIDGLADRAVHELGFSPRQTGEVRAAVAPLCSINGIARDGSLERVGGVANAYKHDVLQDGRHPISSADDVLVVGSGYGQDAYGIGKRGTPEVMVRQTDGEARKFLGDVPYAVAGWIAFLRAKGATLPAGPFVVCNKTIP